MKPTLAETWTGKWDKAAQRGADRESFPRGFAAAATPYEAAGDAAAASGDGAAARDAYLKAYGLYRMARFALRNTDGQKQAYRPSARRALNGTPAYGHARDRRLARARLCRRGTSVGCGVRLDRSAARPGRVAGRRLGRQLRRLLGN